MVLEMMNKVTAEDYPSESSQVKISNLESTIKSSVEESHDLQSVDELDEQCSDQQQSEPDQIQYEEQEEIISCENEEFVKEPSIDEIELVEAAEP
jgi:hypothetical protein